MVFKTIVPILSERRGGDVKKGSSNRGKDKRDELLEVLPTVVPNGTLRVEEQSYFLDTNVVKALFVWIDCILH